MRKSLKSLSRLLLKRNDQRLHHTKLPQYMREMKKYHLAHHYKNFDLGFGVTCMLLDFLRSVSAD